jgi:hypothetical protein
MDGLHFGTCSWRVDEVIMLYIIDDLYLMHDWHISSTLVEAPTSSLFGTCFMEDLPYMYGIHYFVVLVHGDIHVWYTHIWHMLDDITPLVLLD